MVRLIVLLLAFAFLTEHYYLKAKTPELEEEQKLMEAFKQTYKIIRNSSIATNKNSPQQLIFSAIKGMINSLEDPYSVFLQGTSLQHFMKSIENNYSGIGIYIVTNVKGIFIVDVIPDSPAWTIGIQKNDIIIKINDTAIVGKNVDESKALLLGPEGSLVKITILRGDEELNFNLIRKSIKIKTVKHELLPIEPNTSHRIGYIKVTTFGQETGQEFAEALIDLKKQRATTLIIDLRNNPGGLLAVVAEMVNLFITQGSIVSTKRVHNISETIKAERTVLFPSFVPIAILINRYSASASEIFAGAMKDHKRAVLIGDRSYGKFSVQQIFQLWEQGENSAALKLTIAKYFLPNGNSFDHKGIPPHIYIKNQVETTNLQPENKSPIAPPLSEDPFVKKAIEVTSHLKNYQKTLDQTTNE